MELKLKCDSCGCNFKLSAQSLKERKVTAVKDKKELVFTYFVCPDCGREYAAQVDDEKSSKWLAKLTVEMHKAAAAKSRGLSTNGFAAKISNLRGLLGRTRSELVKNYNDKECVDEFGVVSTFHINLFSNAIAKTDNGLMPKLH